MRILFIYPNAEGYGRVPLGPCIIISCLLREGHKIELFDTTFIRQKGHEENAIREKSGFVLPIDMSQLYDPHKPEEIDELLRQQIQRFSPDLVAMSIVEQNYRYGDHLLRVVKSVDEKVPIIVGGTTPTIASDVVIENPRIDYLCQGEGEEAIVEFCDLMEQGKSVEGVRNIRYKKGGEIRGSPPRPLVDMNSLPVQNLELWDESHFLKPYTGRLRRTAYFEMSRGCPNRCSYCLHERCRLLLGGSGPYYRQKSVANTIKEIKMLKVQYGFEVIFFCDDNFLLMSHQRFSEFIEAWKSEIKLPFWMNTSPEAITEDRLVKLKEAGCHGIGIGIESGSEWIRQNILHRRYITNDELEERIRLIASTGIRITASNMMGSPGEYEDDIFETVKFNRKLRPASLDMLFMAPYIGTGVYETARQLGYLNLYKIPGFRGMVKNITMRNSSKLRLPQISRRRLSSIQKKFAAYVYGDLEIPKKFAKPAPGAYKGAPSRDSDGREIITIEQLRK